VLNSCSKERRSMSWHRLHDAELTIVDVGVDADFGTLPGLLQRKVRSGTRNMLHEPAMTEEEMLQALQVGLQLATGAHEKGQALVAVGEMGIGNTTSASAITAVLTRQAPAAGYGQGGRLGEKCPGTQDPRCRCHPTKALWGKSVRF